LKNDISFLERLKLQCKKDGKGRYNTNDVINVGKQIDKERIEALRMVEAYRAHLESITKR
jgi:hypothetical protein